ncbi:hypothetical protein B7494_g1765 [Chlorociboria aeruginascens]|nr:hypothetical protein B7494_g1765 [Chlorociboria aeruginascens]
MLSHVTRAPGLAVATSKVRVAVKADEIVETECCDWPKSAENRSDNGTIPILARTYIATVPNNPLLFRPPLNPGEFEHCKGMEGATMPANPAFTSHGLASLVKVAERSRKPCYATCNCHGEIMEEEGIYAMNSSPRQARKRIRVSSPLSNSRRDRTKTNIPSLSITEWKPVTGSLPPMSASDWESEFTKYQSSPEYKLLNPHMTLSEFQKIYFMEWTHRLWGRVIGLSFVLPTIYFIARRKVSLPMAGRLVGISGLIGFQGFIGWWMVKSGLKDDLFTPGSHPRVSQYRLTAHLGTAFLCYTAMLWNGLSILRTHKLLSYPPRSHQYLLSLLSPALSPFRKSVAFLAVLVFTTAMSGALVAGLDAGLIYNEFPRMGLGLAPPHERTLLRFLQSQRR